MLDRSRARTRHIASVKYRERSSYRRTGRTSGRKLNAFIAKIATRSTLLPVLRVFGAAGSPGVGEKPTASAISLFLFCPYFNTGRESPPPSPPPSPPLVVAVLLGGKGSPHVLAGRVWLSPVLVGGGLPLAIVVEFSCLSLSLRWR